jgi:FkbM family methyltransferase
MKSSDTIIDVGANVGDTLAGMVHLNSDPNYICIEPDDFFYNILLENIRRIKFIKTDLKVTAIKSLVGKNITNVSLHGKGGTKHAVINDVGVIKSSPLDVLLKSIDHSEVRVLKSDVDGYDFDVLDSSIDVLEKYKPILFFELQCDFDFQMKGYIKTLRLLDSIGYSDWTIFDNFGAIILRTKELNILIQLIEYLWTQNNGESTRTIHYYDVLANQDNDSEFIADVLSSYS